MGELYDLCTRVTEMLERRHSDDPIALIRAKGEIATATGFLVSLVSRGEPDDAEKISALRNALAGLGISV